jgi:hypothetical protein
MVGETSGRRGYADSLRLISKPLGAAAIAAAIVAGQTALCATGKGQEPHKPAMLSVHWPLLAVSAIAAPAWLHYSWTMTRLIRREMLSADITMGVDHYSVQAAG